MSMDLPDATIERTKAPLDEVAFVAAMYWRIAYGALRFAIGLKLLQLVGMPAIDIYQRVMRRELSDDPHDQIFQFVGHTLAQHGFSITYFLAAHFLFWGLVDMVLSYAMIRHRLWAFIAGIYSIAAFMAYEIYRFSHTHSGILFAFICMDAFFVCLIAHEYRKLKARRGRFD